MIKLSDYDRFKISYNLVDKNVVKLELRNGNFYAKKCNQDEAFRELIGKKIFDIVGIKCPEYYFLEKENCVISEDLNDLPNFQYINDISSVKKCLKSRQIISLDLISNLLMDIIYNKDEIKLQVNIMHFIDILFSNVDRHICNYGISIDENNNGNLIVFDNGLFLYYFDKIVKPPSTVNLKYPKERIGEIEYFIKNLSSEHKKYIYEIFCRLTPYNVLLIMDKIEREYNFKFSSKNKLIINYTKNYFILNGLINKFIGNNIRKKVNSEFVIIKKK